MLSNHGLEYEIRTLPLVLSSAEADTEADIAIAPHQGARNMLLPTGSHLQSHEVVHQYTSAFDA